MSLLFNKPLIYIPAQKKVESAPVPTILPPNAMMNVRYTSGNRGAVDGTNIHNLMQLKALAHGMSSNSRYDNIMSTTQNPTGDGYNFNIGSSYTTNIMELFAFEYPANTMSFLESAKMARWYCTNHESNNSSPSGTYYNFVWYYCDENSKLYKFKRGTSMQVPVTSEVYIVSDRSGYNPYYSSYLCTCYVEKFNSSAITHFTNIQSKLNSLGILPPDQYSPSKLIITTLNLSDDDMKKIYNVTDAVIEIDLNA